MVTRLFSNKDHPDCRSALTGTHELELIVDFLEDSGE